MSAPASAPESVGPRRAGGRVNGADKVARRRQELARAALATLSELGYARTSLREIAEHSAFSHGVVHYYFADKVELITEAVREYKRDCVTRYDGLVEQAETADELAAGFGAALARTLIEDGHLHRLWYDLRNQSLFEDAFRDDVHAIDDTLEAMIWRVVDRYASLAGAPAVVDAGTAYALFDGLFLRALVRVSIDDPGAADDLAAAATALLRRLVPRP